MRAGDIAVGRGEPHQHLVAGLHRYLADPERLPHEPAGRERVAEADRLLDGGARIGGIGHPPPQPVFDGEPGGEGDRGGCGHRAHRQRVDDPPRLALGDHASRDEFACLSRDTTDRRARHQGAVVLVHPRGGQHRPMLEELALGDLVVDGVGHIGGLDAQPVGRGRHDDRHGVVVVQIDPPGRGRDQRLGPRRSVASRRAAAAEAVEPRSHGGAQHRACQCSRSSSDDRWPRRTRSPDGAGRGRRPAPSRSRRRAPGARRAAGRGSSRSRGRARPHRRDAARPSGHSRVRATASDRSASTGLPPTGVRVPSRYAQAEGARSMRSDPTPRRAPCL